MLSFLAWSLSWSAAAHPTSSPPVDAAAPIRTLTVVGTARVDLVPDEACVELTFAARDPAMGKAHEALLAEVGAFERAVGSRQRIHLERGATRYEGEYGTADRRITAYHASQQLNVRTKEFDEIPVVVGLAAEHGLAAVQVVYYDTAAVSRKAELREQAMKAAREKAEAMAAGFGARLGAVRTVREAGGSSRGGFGANVSDYGASPEIDVVGAPEAPGSLPMTLAVEVEYDLEPLR